MKININKKDRDAFLRTVINAGYNYQLHVLDNEQMISAYVMDSHHRELTVTEAFWLGSIFRCEIQEDIRKAIESETESMKSAWRPTAQTSQSVESSTEYAQLSDQ